MAMSWRADPAWINRLARRLVPRFDPFAPIVIIESHHSPRDPRPKLPPGDYPDPYSPNVIYRVLSEQESERRRKRAEERAEEFKRLCDQHGAPVAVRLIDEWDKARERNGSDPDASADDRVALILPDNGRGREPPADDSVVVYIPDNGTARKPP
jgi:hypothetical protein